MLRLKSILPLSLVLAAILGLSATTKAANVIQDSQNAKVKMVIYGDYQCPFTKRSMAFIEQLQQDYGDQLSIYFAHFPLKFHDQAEPAAIAAVCANQQGKFWEYSKSLFENQSALAKDYYPKLATELKLQDQAAFEACLQDSRIKSSVQLEYLVGEAHGVKGTPHTFINGEAVAGSYPYLHIKEIIDSKLAE